MAITVDAAQNSGDFGDNTTLADFPYPNNLTAGRMIVVVGWMWNNGSAFGPFASGDCTKTAGTATLDTITLATQRRRTTSGAFQINVGIWSALVTGSGSCTMQIGTFPAGSFSAIALMEVSTDVGWDSGRLEASSSNDGSSTTPDSGNATSAGGALFVGGQVANFGTNSAITPDGAFSTCFESENGTAHQPGSAIYRVVSSGTTDSASWTNAANDQWGAIVAAFKELTPATGQTLRPDADTTTTGWTTTPLWSKIEETSADGTVITATAS